MQESFTIKVDLLDQGNPQELEVIPEDTYFEILSNGVLLTKLEYQFDIFPHWSQIEGNVEQETVNLIGDKIESKLA